MRILTDCASCGHVVSVDPNEARLILFRPSTGRPPLGGRFSFQCPSCGDHCHAAVTPSDEVRLLDIGVPVELVDDPRDRHPSVYGRRVRSGAVLDAAPFTERDVRALREVLSRDDWYEQLLAVE